ncbi:MAG TPA: hypothetical protein DCM38_01700 [Gammaproteobacteria bacterium]|nr:hypothetical protein [Gammaproteobacteria bacterium]
MFSPAFLIGRIPKKRVILGYRKINFSLQLGSKINFALQLGLCKINLERKEGCKINFALQSGRKITETKSEPSKFIYLDDPFFGNAPLLIASPLPYIIDCFD